MFSKTPQHSSGSSKTQKTAARLFVSMSDFVSICAERSSRVSRKIKAKATRTIMTVSRSKDPSSPATFASRQKQFLLKISNKAVGCMQPKNIGSARTKPEEWGDVGIWQKDILMGDKCQPLDFSGVIYYDSSGNQVDGVPIRSPRASPLPGYISRKAAYL